MPTQMIEVTPARNEDGSIDWTLCLKNPGGNPVCGTKGSFPEVVLPANTGPHVFIVSINDPWKLGVGFAQDALWIQQNTKPQGPVIGPPSQIADVTRANKQTLVFVDKNKGPDMKLVYGLNFVGPDGKTPVTAIDPDIKNTGGTGGSGFQWYSMESGALLIAGVVLMLIAAKLFRLNFARRM